MLLTADMKIREFISDMISICLKIIITFLKFDLDEAKFGDK